MFVVTMVTIVACALVSGRQRTSTSYEDVDVPLPPGLYDSLASAIDIVRHSNEPMVLHTLRVVIRVGVAAVIEMPVWR